MVASSLIVIVSIWDYWFGVQWEALM